MSASPAVCEIDGCNALAHARRWCKKHYDRWQRHGDPTVCFKRLSPRGAPMAWIVRHQYHADDACLTWPFSRLPDGRARMKDDYPTRIMCELVHGPAPTPEHQAAHICGKGHEACVNPRHLYWATPLENNADKVIHQTIVMGEAHPAAKLTDEDVREIRRLRGTMLQKDIASAFGVNITCINKILNGRSWKHIR